MVWKVSSKRSFMLEKTDHKEITIKKDATWFTHYKRDIDITWFTQDGLRPHRNWQSFIFKPSNKMKGYNLQQINCTYSSLSHNLSHTIIEIILQCYNTIHNCNTILSFYRGITVVRIYPHCRSRNDSLAPIGHKGRFLLLENRKKEMEVQVNRIVN